MKIVLQKSETFCDKCGKNIENPLECYNKNYALRHVSAKITFWPVGEPRSSFGQRIDLCEDCCNDFVKFLEGGRAE